MSHVSDSLGLVPENQFLTVYIPAKNTALVWRVKSRVNKGYEVINYGPLPLAANEILPTFDGGAVTVPAYGVMPARSLTPIGRSFPMPGAYDETDMWYLPEDYSERIFHVITHVTPGFLMLDIQIPMSVQQGKFQRDKITTGIDRGFGFTRGSIETVHLHRVHYGYRWGNDTNMAVFTSVRFVYGEYIIEIPRDPELIFSILTRRIPSHWVTLPLNVWDATIDRAMTTVYGFTGFPVYGVHEREKAVEEYGEILKSIRS